VALFRRIRGILNHYSLGAKLLHRHWTMARRLQKRVQAGGAKLTYAELVFLRQFRADMAVGVPFVLLFALPIVGYLAPALAVFAPRYVPSTFHTPAQVLSFVRLDARAARGAVSGLLAHCSIHPASCGLEQLRALLRRVERGSVRVGRLSTLLPLARLLSALAASPLALPRSQLVLLQRALCHSGFVPKLCYTSTALTRSLEKWRARVWAEDQLLLREGVDELTAPQLARALADRGIYRRPIQMGAVLAEEQAKRLQSVDKKKQKELKEAEEKAQAQVTAGQTGAVAADGAAAPPAPTAFTPDATVTLVAGVPPPSDPVSTAAVSAAAAGRPLSERTVFDPPLLPPPPPAELLEDWRQTLLDWLQLHERLQGDTEAALAQWALPQREAEADRIAQLIETGASGASANASTASQTAVSNSDNSTPAVQPAENAAQLAAPAAPVVPDAESESLSAADVTAAASAAAPVASSGASASAPPAFPLVFLCHAGPLARVISTAEELAAVQPQPDSSA